MRALIGSLAGSRSIFGEDYASNYGTFPDGSNGGYGFQAWDFDAIGGGTFLGSSVGAGFGDINTNGISFGAFGNPVGNSIDVKRNLPSNLSLGYALSASIAVNFRNGNKGFSAYNDAGWSQEVFNFNVGSNNYAINGVNTNQAYSPTMIARIVLKKTTPDSYSYTVKLDSTTYTQNDITYNGYGNIRGFKFYISGTDQGDARNDLYFNSIKVYKIEEPLVIPVTTYTTFVTYE